MVRKLVRERREEKKVTFEFCDVRAQFKRRSVSFGFCDVVAVGAA